MLLLFVLNCDIKFKSSCFRDSCSFSSSKFRNFILILTVFSCADSRCSNKKAPATQYATTSVIRVTCENTQVKTFHEKHKQDIHLLLGGGSTSRSKRRVDIFLHLNFTQFPRDLTLEKQDFLPSIVLLFS